MPGPVEVLVASLGQQALDQLQQSDDGRVEIAGHGLAAEGRVGVGLGHQGGVVLPPRPALQRPLERRAQEGLEQTLQRHGVARSLGVAVDGGDAFAVPDLGAAGEDGVEQLLLGPEIIVDQGRIHARLARHLADGDAVEAVFRKQVFGGVEDGVAGLARAGGLGLLGPAATGRGGRDGRQGRGEIVVTCHARKLERNRFRCDCL
ncbi:hypothetical protein D3C72_924710 [compost metagenome]